MRHPLFCSLALVYNERLTGESDCIALDKEIGNKTEIPILYLTLKTICSGGISFYWE